MCMTYLSCRWRDFLFSYCNHSLGIFDDDIFNVYAVIFRISLHKCSNLALLIQPLVHNAFTIGMIIIYLYTHAISEHAHAHTLTYTSIQINVLFVYIHARIQDENNQQSRVRLLVVGKFMSPHAYLFKSACHAYIQILYTNFVPLFEEKINQWIYMHVFCFNKFSALHFQCYILFL